MLVSKVEFVNGKPFVSVNGKLHPSVAYTSYFDECADYSAFIKHGYKMFFVNVSFTDLPINNVTGFSPFRTGVFETDVPDYTAFDNLAAEIVSLCPDALIFPRIHLSMPRKWVAAHPKETVRTINGGNRESMYSDAFRRDGTALLSQLVSHIRSSSYAGSIAGWQLCGGTTQEWMHHDLCGSFSEMGMEKFKMWCVEKCGSEPEKIPEKADFAADTLHPDVQKYYRFCSEMTADTVAFFARQLKKMIHNEQIVGVFYGYTAFVSDPLCGLHALGDIIDCPHIDFFSSPCCYDNNRNPGVDWGDMLPVDSLKLHKKLYFVECDIRTHLTRRMQLSRPGEYSDEYYNTHNPDASKTVWCGPETAELSLSALRKTFAHQITKASGLWWFDMWGGWYRDDRLMADLVRMKTVYEQTVNRNTEDFPAPETAFFVDEKAYANYPRGHRFAHSVTGLRVALGNTGIPFDMYSVEDAPEVLHKYKAAVFSAPLPSAAGEKALALCRKMSIPVICPDAHKHLYSTEELRAFLVGAGVHCYNADNNVVYCANGFLGIHTIREGEQIICLPQPCKVTPLFGTQLAECVTDRITLTLPKHATAVFRLLRQLEDTL